jgi:hypothetical protein
MQENTHCYTFEEHRFSRGLLDKSVDATYVIHLKNNGRYDTILKEIKDYKMTSITYILINDGYKKCEKMLPKQAPGYDLIDATMQIYSHANQMHYKNILILEDDCIFNKEIQDTNVQNDLNTFFNNNSESPFIYRLGCLPFFMLPFITHVPYSIGCGAHAYVISEPSRQYIITLQHSDIAEIDSFLNTIGHQYVYYKPLAYQLYPETENQKTWGYDLNTVTPVIGRIGANCVIQYCKVLGVDKTIEPGHSISYIFAKILASILICLVLFGLYITLPYVPYILKAIVIKARKIKGRK